MKDFSTLKKELLKNAAVSREYERLAPRYRVVSELIAARLKKGMTQKELAEKLGTKQSAVARFEAGNVNPSLEYLERAASAMGFKFKIFLQ